MTPFASVLAHRCELSDIILDGLPARLRYFLPKCEISE
jgi:hypothetical protein